MLKPRSGRPIFAFTRPLQVFCRTGYEVLQPNSGSYFCLSEGKPSFSAWQTPPASQADQQVVVQRVLAEQQAQPQTAPIYFDVGIPALCAMRINGNQALINLLGSFK